MATDERPSVIFWLKHEAQLSESWIMRSITIYGSIRLTVRFEWGENCFQLAACAHAH